MGFFTKLFSSASAVEETVQTVNKGLYNGLDMLFFTDEEKNTLSQEAQDKLLDFHLKMAANSKDESSIRSVTRRILAVMIMSVWVILVLAVAILICIDQMPQAQMIIELLDMTSPVFLSVVVFYFGPEVISRVITRIKSK